MSSKKNIEHVVESCCKELEHVVEEKKKSGASSIEIVYDMIDLFFSKMKEAGFSMDLDAYLEEEMSKIIQSFNLSYTAVIVDPDTLEFRVLDPSGIDVSVSQLSGGEQTAIALAFVIGLNRVLGGITGFLVLDEPTTHLDPERRKSLIDIIERAVSQESGIRQLIIVTHHEEVRDAADVLCTVSKVGDTSRVECE